MSRNYGVGTRDLASAGRIFLQTAAQQKAVSLASVDTLADRWAQFAAFSKENGVGRMERVTQELVQQYGQQLAEKVQSKQISASYAQNLVSSVNTVMHLTPKSWESVSPTRDCGIAERSLVRTEPVLTQREPLSVALHSLRESGDYRGAAVAELARELGLRSKEAALLNAHDALKQAEKGYISVIEGTKGGRYREVPVLHEKQLEALKNAAEAQKDSRAVIPADKNWAQYRNELQNVREILKENGYAGLHDLRSAYAADRYEQITGQVAPVNNVGVIVDRANDYAAREQITAELGHGRIDVVAAYIGGR